MKSLNLKPFILFFLFFQLLSTNSVCQKEIIFDFSTKKFENNSDKQLEDLKIGDTYQLVIKNLNPNLYKVALEKKDSAVEQSLPEDLFGKINLEILKNLVGSLSPIGNIAGAATLPIEQSNQLMEFMVNQKMSTFNSNDISRFFTEINPASEEPENKKIAQELLDDMMDFQKEKLRDIENINNSIEDLKIKYLLHLKSVEVEFSSTSLHYNSLFDPALSISDIKTDFLRIRSMIKNLLDEIARNYRNYKVETTLLKTTIENTEKLKKANINIVKVHEEQSKTLSIISKTFSAEVFDKMLSALIKMENGSNNVYRSLPIQYSKNFNTLEININPRDPKGNLHPYSTTIEFPVIKNDFWGGSTNFFYSNLYDRGYSSISEVNSNQDTIFKIKEENIATWQFGVAAMVNYGRKFSNDSKNSWNIGIGPGAVIGNKIEPRLLIGGGIAFAGNNRFLLNGGIIIGPTEVKSNTVDLSKEYIERPTDMTISKNQVGGFISLGYLIVK